MTWVLVKKQLNEAFSFLFYNRRNGKLRQGVGLWGFAATYIILFGFLGYIFYELGAFLCKPFFDSGIGWLYFTLMSLIALMMSVIGSVFTSYTSIYKAKDNDILLSMPIKPRALIFARLSGIYLLTLIYDLIVMIPVIIVYILEISPDITSIIFTFIIPFLISLIALVISCILGWLIAAVSKKVKSQRIVTISLSLLFIAAYFYIYNNAYKLLEGLLVSADGIASSLDGSFSPLYHMGNAALGDPLSMLIFILITAILFTLTFLLLSKSFFKLSTVNHGDKKKKYQKSAQRASTPDKALFKKELGRFTASASYMLNCGLGTVFPVVFIVLLIVNYDTIKPLTLILGKDESSLLMIAAVCLSVAMNDITAPSVSLEGKNIWIIQSLPVDPWQVLKAKLKLHIIITVIPALLLCIFIEIFLTPTLLFAILLPISVILFIFLTASIGLWANLKFPNLSWTNETAPIKQSLSVFIGLFCGWVIIAILGIVYYLVYELISASLFIVLVDIILLFACICLNLWLKRRGSAILARLS